jgi:molybdenum-dependent DNA-binding transcriptional regulator ModE
MTTMDEARAGSAERPDSGPDSDGATPQGVELRHLRCFVALADAGTFTHAAEQMFVAQPTLSQQIRRLEEMVGAPLLQRGREGVRLTEAGSVLLEESRAVLSRVDRGVSRTRQAAGLGRPRLIDSGSPLRKSGHSPGGVPRCERASDSRPWHHLGQPDENHLGKEHPQCLRSRSTA